MIDFHKTGHRASGGRRGGIFPALHESGEAFSAGNGLGKFPFSVEAVPSDSCAGRKFHSVLSEIDSSACPDCSVGMDRHVLQEFLQ